MPLFLATRGGDASSHLFVQKMRPHFRVQLTSSKTFPELKLELLFLCVFSARFLILFQLYYIANQAKDSGNLFRCFTCFMLKYLYGNFILFSIYFRNSSDLKVFKSKLTSWYLFSNNQTVYSIYDHACSSHALLSM